MVQQTFSEVVDVQTKNDEPMDRPLAPQLRMMTRVLLASPERMNILLLAGALVVVIGATAFSQIRLNAWNQPFYDALERKDISAFLDQLIVFGVIAGILLCLNVAQGWLNQMIKLKLREWLVSDLFEEWLKPGRAYRLASAGKIGDNPDQRIHADVRNFTELTSDLGIGLLQSSVLLASFIGVLWVLSGDVRLDVNGRSIAIPGYMVWCALFYAGTASWLSWRVGRPLIRLQAERFDREAELRYALVRLNEHIDTVAVCKGEAEELRRLRAEFGNVLRMMRRIVSALTGLNWVTAGYGWFTIIAPILVAAPAYFGGELTFGGMMMAVGAFIQVQQALRWFVDNFSTIAQWRATLFRITSFREVLIAAAEVNTANQIAFVQAPKDTMIFDKVEIASPTGGIMLSEPHVELGLGERVLITGQPGTGKTILFRAMAGLWPWGGGCIALPDPERMVFVPRRPYVPPGTVRAALLYPKTPAVYGDDELNRLLQSAGLQRIASSLDLSARWDLQPIVSLLDLSARWESVLTEDEQQLLVFARLLLHKPDWVVIDEALDLLEEDARRQILAMLANELPNSTIVHIGRPETGDHFFTRVLHLAKDPHGRTFAPRGRAPAVEAPALGTAIP
jgi:putative ATP-binding cassette transporter